MCMCVLKGFGVKPTCANYLCVALGSIPDLLCSLNHRGWKPENYILQTPFSAHFLLISDTMQHWQDIQSSRNEEAIFSASGGASGSSNRSGSRLWALVVSKGFSSIYRKTSACLVPTTVETGLISPVYQREVKTGGLQTREESSFLIFR